jgi:hypothetical protein
MSWGVVGSQRPVEVAPYRRRSRGRWILGWVPRSGGVMEHRRRCRRKVDLASVGELQVEQ